MGTSYVRTMWDRYYIKFPYVDLSVVVFQGLIITNSGSFNKHLCLMSPLNGYHICFLFFILALALTHLPLLNLLVGLLITRQLYKMSFPSPTYTNCKNNLRLKTEILVNLTHFSNYLKWSCWFFRKVESWKIYLR